MKLFAAFGQAISKRQMTQFAGQEPSFFSTGYIEDYKLVFRGSHPNIEKCQGSKVPVVLWNIDFDEIRLDAYEGATAGIYKKETVKVKLDDQEEVEAIVYVQAKEYPPDPPALQTCAYLFDGYRMFNLDYHYFAEALDEFNDDNSAYYQLVVFSGKISFD